MQIEQSVVDALVAHPAEALSVEVKRWIDPDAMSGVEKIVKAVLALRNRNGGYLVIGFDNNTLVPDSTNTPIDVRSAFHIDKIQGLVSRYSSELFEIGIAYCTRDGSEHPVVVVPSGVRNPVAAKRALVDSGRTLIRLGAVYFRTLAANGTPSTAEARPEDWRDITELCFDNREADVGRFVRRQVAGLDLASLNSILDQIGLISAAPPPPTLRERAEGLLQDGEQRFRRALQDRTVTPVEQAMIDSASWQVALIIDPSRTDALPDRSFATSISASNPNYTGWPVWLDSSSFTETDNRPRVKDKAIETTIISPGGWSKHLDFSRIDPKGEFFLRRILQDDAVERIPPGIVMDPIIVILRVAEAIAVGLAFAKALGWPTDTTRLGFAFRWTKLAGRDLTPWANPGVSINAGKAHDDEVTTFIELSLDTPASAIAPLVDQATRDLFVIFDGYLLPRTAIEEWVRRLIERRLNS